jgi:transcriptional regulator GlxA family with amidase domain
MLVHAAVRHTAGMACNIVFVLFPGFQQLDLAGPMAAFEVAELARPGSYRWRLVANMGGNRSSGSGPGGGSTVAVRSSAGVAWPVQNLPRQRSGIDLVMVIGGDGVDAACRDSALLRWLQRAACSVPRVGSICSGSLVLAAAGLLNERTATTHWSRSRQFAAHHPRVHLQPDRIYVHEPAVRHPFAHAEPGSRVARIKPGATPQRSRSRSQQQQPELWTSAGMTAGIDLCLALIAHDHGEALALEVARQLVVERRRPAGQTQFSSLLDLQRPEGRFGALLEHVRSHLHEPHTVDALAARACMSPRHFARAFSAETGTPPAHAVERLRVEAARAALEGGRAVQAVARDCGFGNAERMRRAFQRLLGRPPAALRRKAP